MSSYQGYLKPAYSGPGAAASVAGSPAPVGGQDYMNSRPLAAQSPSHSQHNGPPTSTYLSSYSQHNGPPTSTYLSSSSQHNGPPGSASASPAIVLPVNGPASTPSCHNGPVSPYVDETGAPGSAVPPRILSPPPSYTNTPSPKPQNVRPASIQPTEQPAVEVLAAVPSQSTFPPPKDEKVSYMQSPSMVYQSHQHLPEKPQPPMGPPNGHHHHNHPQTGPMAQFSKWTFGVFDCFTPLSTCCLGTWCPCILYGITQDRESGKGETSGIGLMCCAWCCSAYWGLYGCMQCVTRGSQRKRHGIEGDCCTDFILSCCCSCCTMIQEEKESMIRFTGIDPTTNVRYQPVNQGMHYPA